jgi:hypothetical protein
MAVDEDAHLIPRRMRIDRAPLQFHAPLRCARVAANKTTRRREIIRDGVRDDRSKGGSGHQDRVLQDRPPEGRGDHREVNGTGS